MPYEYNDITLSKTDEYFIAIAKQGIHSFMMLGVMDKGNPKLLTRVGANNDVDPNAASQVVVTIKQLGSGNLARLYDEGIVRSSKHVTPISYQAYSLSFQQAKEFIGLIAEVEREQLNNPEIKEGIIRAWKRDYPEDVERSDDYILNLDAIRSYVPFEKDNGDEVTFKWEVLKNCRSFTEVEKNRDDIIQGASQIQVRNTCRTTSLNIVKAILGFDPDVSKHFFISPKYKTTLEAGQPNKTNFYVFPPPPIVGRDALGGTLSEKQFDVLTKLYKKMEQLPKQNPESGATRAKFDALKATYNDIMGSNELNATALIAKINEHEGANSSSLFHKRDPNFFSRLFSIKSSTERMFIKFKDELGEAKKKEGPDEQSTPTVSMSH